MSKGYPPRIDATPEEIARTVLKGGRPEARVKSQDYRVLLASFAILACLLWSWVSCVDIRSDFQGATAH